MKTNTMNSSPKSPRNRAFALVVVLSILTLLTVLVVAFFLNVTGEVTSTKAFSSGSDSKQLADSAVNLVIAQIRDATAGFPHKSNGTLDRSTRLAWTSQPGLIRTFDDDGKKFRAFKLYSSGSMVVDEDQNLTLGDIDVSGTDWAKSPALAVDLNAPSLIQDQDGTIEIQDPTSGQLLKYRASYPIIDPSVSQVEGFNVKAPPSSYKGTFPVTPTQNPTGSSADANPLPMPAKWLYVLQNGALVPPSGAGLTATVNGATETNPIVGRIAFWTDDETCKVNINTASEGIFWDQPRGATIVEKGKGDGGGGAGKPLPLLTDQPNGVFGFGWSLPFQNEFQRTPGHPAMVCLSTVLGSSYIKRPDRIDQNTYKDVQKYYGGVTSGIPDDRLAWPAPRTVEGGSKGGTVITDINSKPVPIGQSRLYASVDELFYRPSSKSSARESGTTSASFSKALNANAFFLSANSRAPEVTLWGTPRMSVWPLMEKGSVRNSKDKLLAFCSTIGLTGKNEMPFYFTRATAANGETPGSAASPTEDIQLSRNKKLYEYLESLLQEKVPGLGGVVNSAQVKSERQQTLTEIFDYIRSFVNAYKTDIDPKYSFATAQGPGIATVVPMDGPNGTHGLGRISTIREVAMLFYAADIYRDGTFADGRAVPPRSPWPDDPEETIKVSGTDVVVKRRTPYTKEIGMALLLNPYIVSPGSPRVSPSVLFRVSGLKSISITTGTGAQAIKGGFFDDDLAEIGIRSTNGIDSRTALTGLRDLLWKSRVRQLRDPGSRDPYDGFRQMYNTRTVHVPDLFQYEPEQGTAGYFHLNGGDLKIEIFDGFATGRSLVQTLNVTLPAGTFPIPTLRRAKNRYEDYPASKAANKPKWCDAHWVGVSGTTTDVEPVYYTGMSINPMNFAQRFTGFTGESWESTTPLGKGYGDFESTGLIKRGDIVRSVQVKVDEFPHGDMRIVAAMKNVPNDFFGPRLGFGAYSIGVGTGTNGKITNMVRIVHQAHSFVYGRTSYQTMGYRAPVIRLGGTNDLVCYPPFSQIPDDFGNSWNPLLTVGSVYPEIQYSGMGDYPATISEKTTYSGTIGSALISHAPYGLNGAYMNGKTSTPGDWDNGFGNVGDGPFVNKTDEAARDKGVYLGAPDRVYFPDDAATQVDDGPTYSPSRQIASPVMFGSLPAGLSQSGNGTSWRTLLFCPNPAAGSKHPGFGMPTSGTAGPNAKPPYTNAPDHVWLDLFWMPVVEPYAISEPFSTAGKVNLNQQIIPFGNYIERTTALRAVLKPMQLAAIPSAAALPRSATPKSIKPYKWTNINNASNIYGVWGNGLETPWDFRYEVNLDATIDGFKKRYGSVDTGDVFRSASEICSVFLVPKRKATMSYDSAATPTSSIGYNNVENWWRGKGFGPNDKGFYATGDNTREAPYNQIYPLVTTKSNTFRVHFTVQSLKKSPVTTTNPANVFQEGKDQVVGEYRGSTLIERYIDPNDPTMPDFTAALSDQNPSPADKYVLDKYYRFRVLQTKRFMP